jgi:hemoglobin-like flavoprotein
MTPEHVQLIRLSFLQVAERKDETGQMFYRRLFEIAPETRSLFKGDINGQARKLMDTLGIAISSLKDMPTLIATLQALAVRHAGYGVRDEHYDKVGEALIWTLQQVLGPAFTPEVKNAWAALYGTVASVMRAAAAGPARRASAAS